MIIKGLLQLVYSILSALLVFDLPALPDTITTLLESLTEYVVTGINIIRGFVGETAVGVMALLLTLVVSMNAAYFLYSFVFWVLRKIPMLGIEE